MKILTFTECVAHIGPLLEMSLDASDITDIELFRKYAEQNEHRVAQQKFILTQYKNLGIPSDVFRHLNNHTDRWHNIDNTHLQDLVEHLKNIHHAKIGKPNSYGANVYVICCQGDLADYYVTLNINSKGNLISTMCIQNSKEVSRYFPQKNIN